MHFTKNDLITTPGYEFLKGYTKDCLKPYFPVGCRDEDTLEVLKDLGYDAYFSGCMTLTIEKIKNIPKSKKDYICATDLNNKCLTYLKENTKIEIKKMTHWTTKEYTELPFGERMERVKELLSVYQNAKLVVTDRLHVALPCLALGTPVVLIYYDYNKDRLGTFTSYLNTFTEEDFLTTDIKVLLKLKNNDKYKEVRNNLISKCKKFISQTDEDLKKLPELEDYKREVRHVEHVSNIFETEIKRLKKENQYLQNQSNELNKIENSKSWKIVKRVINLKQKIIQ